MPSWQACAFQSTERQDQLIFTLLGGVVVIDPTEGVIYQELEEDMGESLRVADEATRSHWAAFVLCCVGLARLHSLAGW